MEQELRQLTDEIETHFMKDLIDLLRDLVIGPPDAKALAIEFLAYEPYASVEDARTKVSQFVEKHPEFAKLNSYMRAYHDDQKTQAVIDRMKQHLKNDDYDSAIAVAQEAQ